ncbi:MAG: hypothetical protein IJL97_05885 [Lachnospiraceae bacterium]|nr:hypothetical protein [Lachnospiraceae bacterium]
MQLLMKTHQIDAHGEFRVYDAKENVLFKVRAVKRGRIIKASEYMTIYDAADNERARIVQRTMAVTPVFDLYVGDEVVGKVTKNPSFMNWGVTFKLDMFDWKLEGKKYKKWEFCIKSTKNDAKIAQMSEGPYRWGLTSKIEVYNQYHALYALLVALAVTVSFSLGGFTG